MTKNEALKAAIDGKKFTHKTGVFPMFFNGDEFVTGQCGRVSMSCLPNDNDYEIVPEFVDFAEAFQAYEEWKTIESKNQTKYHKREQYESAGWFLPCDIRGKWLILEDE